MAKTVSDKAKQAKVVSLIDEWERRKMAGYGYVNLFGLGDPEEDALKATLRKNANVFNATILDELAKSRLADMAFEHVAAHPDQATPTVISCLANKLDRLEHDRVSYSESARPFVKTLMAVVERNPAALSEDTVKGVLSLLCFLHPVTTDAGYPCDQGFEELKRETKAAFDKIMAVRPELFSPFVMGDLQWSWTHRFKEQYFPFHDVQCPFGAVQSSGSGAKAFGTSVKDILGDLCRISGVTQVQIDNAFAQRRNTQDFASTKQVANRHEERFKRLLKDLS